MDEQSSIFSIEAHFPESAIVMKLSHPYVRLFRAAIGSDFVFMDDSGRPHRSHAVGELLESRDKCRMDWPVLCPDLNPIEHMWDALGRRLAARSYPLENTRQLLNQMLIEEWRLFPQEVLNNLVLSTDKQCHATIAVRGGHIHY